MIKDWTGGNSGFYSVNHRKKEIEVEEYDFYCTHPESIKLFLKAAKNTNLIIPNNILEPRGVDGLIFCCLTFLYIYFTCNIIYIK